MIVDEEPILRVEGVSKQFTQRGMPALFGGSSRQTLNAVSNVSFVVRPRELVGIVGESGSGKTTLARMLLGLVKPSSGKVLFRGRDVFARNNAETFSLLRARVRMIFQHPDAVLNPAYPIGVGLAKAMRLHLRASGDEIDRRVEELLRRVGLAGSHAQKYPDELSGGEKRRVGVCRALSTKPEIVVADEPFSGLDVVLQERIIAMLASEQRERGFALVLVSHDLDCVNQLCDRVLVMHAGCIVEDAKIASGLGLTEQEFTHPYSKALQSARASLERGHPAPSNVRPETLAELSDLATGNE
jgi:ABC-type glutathione transport system ATPase component